MKGSWPSQEWLDEASHLVEATGHYPNDILQDEFEVSVKLGYYEAWEFIRDAEGAPLLHSNGERRRQRIREAIPEGFVIKHLDPYTNGDNNDNA